MERHPPGHQDDPPEAAAEPRRHEPFVELRGVTKHFGAVVALSAVSLELAAGEVHALLGENGAGKSTLVGVLQGSYQPEAGEVLVGGKPVRLHSAQDALAHGIGLVDRDPVLFHDGRALEDEERERLRHVAAELALAVDLDANVRSMTIVQRQLVELLRLFALGADVFIFDEPTAAVHPPETSTLFEAIAALRVRGKAVLLVTHRLPEVLRLADRVTVLRRGRIVGLATTRSDSAGASDLGQRWWQRGRLALFWSRARVYHVRAILALGSLPLSVRLQLLRLHAHKIVRPRKELIVRVRGVPLRFPRESLTVDKLAFERIFALECYAGDYSETTVVDVGAHKGYFAAYAFLRGARSVVSYEPEEENFRCLSDAATAARARGLDWRVHKAALSLRGGERKLQVSSESWAHSLRVLPRTGPRHGIAVQRIPTVAMSLALADAVRAAAGGRVVVKLAVEGAECELVLGSPTVLWEGVHEAFVVVHPFSRCSRAEIVDHFDRTGWPLFREVANVLGFRRQGAAQTVGKAACASRRER
ncbi:MAG: FkbM family methyltransferase [Gaiellaceae bacterium]